MDEESKNTTFLTPSCHYAALLMFLKYIFLSYVCIGLLYLIV